MLIRQMSWMEVEKYLKSDDRMMFVLGATEQHGYLSLSTDTLIPWEIAVKACEKEGVILAPALEFGFSHWALDFPGTLSLRVETYHRMVMDLLSSAIRSGFRNFFLLNGHSGNRGAREASIEAIADVDDARVWFYSWWEMPQTAAFVKERGGLGHANWSENFRFTRLAQAAKIEHSPDEQQYRRSAAAWRRDFPDGVMGEKNREDEKVMDDLLEIAVDECAAILREMLKK